MTELLEKALSEATKLPKQDQDILATMILDEIASNQRWERVYAESADVLAALADEALAEHRTGETQDLDPAQL